MNISFSGKNKQLIVGLTLCVKIDDSKTFIKESSNYEIQYRVSEQRIKESIAT